MEPAKAANAHCGLDREHDLAVILSHVEERVVTVVAAWSFDRAPAEGNVTPRERSQLAKGFALDIPSGYGSWEPEVKEVRMAAACGLSIGSHHDEFAF